MSIVKRTGLSRKKLVIIAVITILVVSVAAIAAALLISIPEVSKMGGAYIALIKIEGPLISSIQYSIFGTVRGVNTYIELLEKARKDTQAKAVILYVNSPGGSAAASEALYYAVKKLSKEKIVVAYIAEYGTSGAYMAILPSDYIVAAESSLVGSIGVYTTIINYKGLLNKLGIQVYTFKSGDLKDVGSPFRNMTEEDAKVFKEIISDLFEIFKSRVKQHRNIRSNEVFSGQPFTANKALELGLIDEIGNYDIAVNITRKIANLKATVPVRELKPRTTGLLDLLFNTSYQSKIKLLPSYEILAMWPPPTIYIEP